MSKRPEPNLRTRALQYLARREYSRAELRSKLLPHVQADESFESQPQENLEVLLDDLTARGWLSEERAVTQLLHAKRSRFGSQRIAHELRQKGFSERLIDEAMPQLKESEFAAAQAVWQKKFGVLPQDQKEKARQVRFLQARGFSMDVIFKVMRLSGSAADEGFKSGVNSR
ncbi:MAG TPA: recombination regulator RecX [Gallionella sp.]|nr:recombination regulator RecX [Gallionella sp.]